MKTNIANICESFSHAAQMTGLAEQLGRLDCSIEIKADTLLLWKHTVTQSDNRIFLNAPMSVWGEVFKQYPRPGFQSLGALYRLCDDIVIEANTKCFMQALPFLESLLEQVRTLLHPASEQQPINDNLSRLKGRYLETSSGWLYIEESGNPHGQVICMLHTAGADARQWHGLMTHDGLQSSRLIAFDMPNHGRSPVIDHNSQWQWRLTESAYIRVVCDFIRSVTDKPVILMGCSMGAAIGLALLAKHPKLCKAAILLETPYHSPGRRTPYLDHPQVHGGRLAATWVASLLSPNSPVARRNLARWIYSQSGPSVYDGDLHFYSDEFQANQHSAQINTDITPVWLLTGDYDYSASPADTRRIADEIPGATFVEMKGFGHFPMTEDPERLYDLYLHSILQTLE